ncbi:MAG: SPOR domain-containing protein [Archangium sp.]|nr:SPOR domain-containing protein [Archangium sp.]
MRDSHRLKEKFELSLDNRQIVSLTVAALVVMGGVFAVGVVVGKKLAAESATRAEAPPTDMLHAVDQRTAALDAVQRDAATLTFQEELTKKVEAAAPPAPVEPPKPVAVAEAPKPDTSPKPEIALKPEATPLPDAPRAEPIATRTNDAGALREAFGRVQATPGTAEWSVQLSASQERNEADRFAAGLRDKGYAPYIIEANVPGKGVWYRVRLGRFPSKDAASRYLADFKRETSMNGMVTSN